MMEQISAADLQSTGTCSHHTTTTSSSSSSSSSSNSSNTIVVVNNDNDHYTYEDDGNVDKIRCNWTEDV